MSDKYFMQRAIDIAAAAIDDPGARPYGAVVVRDGRIIGEGLNRSAEKLDPTSHGETEAIRDACRNTGSTDLTGCTLYASCEPCPLCVAAMLIAGISRLCYAVSTEESAAILSVLPSDGGHHVSTATLRNQVGIDERRAIAFAGKKLLRESGLPRAVGAGDDDGSWPRG